MYTPRAALFVESAGNISRGSRGRGLPQSLGGSRQIALSLHFQPRQRFRGAVQDIRFRSEQKAKYAILTVVWRSDPNFARQF